MEFEDAKLKKRRTESVNFSEVTTYSDTPSPSPCNNNTSESTLLESPSTPNKNVAFRNWTIGDPYEVVKVLGNGSYGEVAEGVDLSHNSRKVAIKRMKNMFEIAQDGTRVYREMHILRQLEHPNIVKLLDLKCPKVKKSTESSSSSILSGDLSWLNKSTLSDLYFVFEYMETDMYKLLNSPQYLTTPHIAYFVYQLLTGLHFLHSANVIHRDLKPANILLREDCSLKICDFGLSRVVAPHAAYTVAPNVFPAIIRQRSVTLTSLVPSSASTAFGTAVAPPALKRSLTHHVVTRWYRAPELILLQDYTASVDIWSLGCILAELLGMEKANISDPHSRSALFPGRSCYPLSVDNGTDDHESLLSSNSDTMDTSSSSATHTTKPSKVNKDQLNCIFEVIGTPSKQDLLAITGTNEKAKQYVQEQKTIYPARDLGAMFPHSDKGFIKMLKQMLQPNPKNRLSAFDALKDDVFDNFRMDEWERPCNTPLSADFESVCESSVNLKYNVLREILWYQDRDTDRIVRCKSASSW